MKETALILEGGGMRGIYTAGVLDFLLEKEIDLTYCNGVSAGACQGVSYMSKQHKRNYDVIIGYIRDKRYLSFGNLLRTGSLFGMDMLFNKIPNELVPFDYEGYKNAGSTFNVGVTNCETGESEFYPIKDFRDGYEVLQASISLPLVAPIMAYDGKVLLDGGITEPIPIYKAIKDGYKKHLVVLTQHQGYTKQPTKITRLLKLKYKKYPKLIEAMVRRHEVYNETVAYIEQLEKEGQCIIIRPSKPLGLGRFDKDLEKLKQAYKQGYEDARNQEMKMKAFLK
ncbi:MAG: patatin-like phospholipase family protein [Cellulosilyticaceae bacterium]